VQLHHKFIDVAKKHGDKIALKDFTTKKDLTYGRTLIASLILSRIFKKMDRGFIGIMIPTSAGCILTYLGVLMSGRTPVMLNYSTGAEHNVRYAQKKCDFKTVITSKTLLKKIDCPFIEGMIYIEDIMASLSTIHKISAALVSKLPTSFIKKMVYSGQDDDHVVILFTSGSEKDPKAVPLTHKNIHANIVSLSQRYSFCEQDIFLASLPLFHVFGLTANLWVPLYYGMTALTYANPLDFRTVCDIVRDNRATLIVGTPSFFWGYLRKSTPGDFDTIRVALCGADKCPEALREGFFKKHKLVLLEAYGATETSPGISGNSMEYNKPGSVGLPFEGVEVRIENYETGELCDTEQDGRILVKGDNIMTGYFDDFEQTSLHIRRGWYDTGDMGNIDDDGYLWHVGRLKRFVKIGGEMVSLVRIEDVLERFLPNECQCCVVEIPDAIKGAKIVAVTTMELDKDEIVSQMSKHLAKIAIPRVFMVLEELPKMGSGKTDFRTITEIARADIAGETGKLF